MHKYVVFIQLFNHASNQDSYVARKRITISINAKVLDWIDAKVEEGEFFNRSHGIEQAVKRRMQDE